MGIAPANHHGADWSRHLRSYHDHHWVRHHVRLKERGPHRRPLLRQWRCDTKRSEYVRMPCFADNFGEHC